MNKSLVFTFAAAVVAVMALATSAVSQAKSTMAAEQVTCTVEAKQHSKGTPMKNFKGIERKYTQIGQKAYIDVVVKGKNCNEAVTLAAWKTPGVDGKPYKQQKLESYMTRTLKTGTHTMSINIPQCHFQLDLVRGSNPKGIDGGGAYQEGRLIHGIVAGTTSCEPVTPPVTPPATPETPETPTTPETPVEELPAELPETGLESVMSLVGASALTGSAGYYINSRRNRA